MASPRRLTTFASIDTGIVQVRGPRTIQCHVIDRALPDSTAFMVWPKAALLVGGSHPTDLGQLSTVAIHHHISHVLIYGPLRRLILVPAELDLRVVIEPAWDLLGF